MFTGIIKELGEIEQAFFSKGGVRLLIKTTSSFSLDIEVGDSISVDGCCLTVIDKQREYLKFDVVPETLSKTGIGEWQKGYKVNLEKALRFSERLDGHFVQGHVDGKGKIRKRLKKEDGSFEMEIACDLSLLAYLIPKGSIAIDGISLTIVSLQKDFFTFSLIPHTAKMTTLGSKIPEDVVHIEIDILSKYAKKFMSTTKEFL